MAGYPVTIRLLDPPLHEFLPSLETLLVETTELRLTKGESDPEYVEKCRILGRVRALHEQNPMLGLRVCRLGILYPEIYAMQVRAIFEAACDLRERGVDVRPDVMIPGVGTLEEMRVTYDAAKTVADEVIARRGCDVDVPHRHDDRAAARVRRRGRDRDDRGVLQLRHERSHADDVRLLARRRRGELHPGVPREEDPQGRSVPGARPRRRRQPDADGRRAAAAARART